MFFVFFFFVLLSFSFVILCSAYLSSHQTLVRPSFDIVCHSMFVSTVFLLFFFFLWKFFFCSFLVLLTFGRFAGVFFSCALHSLQYRFLFSFRLLLYAIMPLCHYMNKLVVFAKAQRKREKAREKNGSSNHCLLAFVTIENDFDTIPSTAKERKI